MYAILVDSATAFGPAPRPLGQANGSATVTFNMPAFVRVPVRKQRAKDTSTAKVESPRDAVDEPAREPDEKLAQKRQAMCEVLARLMELRADAELSDDPSSFESVCDIALFLNSLGITKRPSIFLLDNGNFQAVWRSDATKEQVSLQFFGHGIIQYAMFALHAGSMNRIADGAICKPSARSSERMVAVI